MLVDSVFSSLIASFEEENEEVPYPDDEPILGRKIIEDAFDSVEDKFTRLLTATAWDQTDKYLKKVDKAIASSDRESVLKEKWAISIPVQGLLYGLWSESWGLGTNHSTRELNIIHDKNAGVGAQIRRSEFTKRDAPVFIAYPPTYGIPLQSSDLRAAVEQRTLKLANDVSDQTAARIQAYILEAVDKHKADGGVPPSERKLLVSRINGIIGRQRGLEADRDIPIEERVKTIVGIPGQPSGFHKRARLIAGTELSAAYSLGRLQVYVQAGVKKVRWQAIGDLKTCRVCRSRNGTIHDLDSLLLQHKFAYRHIYDPSQFIFPAHPGCRCHPQPILDDLDKDDKKRSNDKGRFPQLRQIQKLRQGWALAGTAVSLINAVGKEVNRQRENKRQQQRQRQKLIGTLSLAGAAALSLGALYMLLRRQGLPEVTPASVTGQVITQVADAASQRAEDIVAETFDSLQRRSAEAIAAILPVTPDLVLTEELKQRYQNLLNSGIDLKNVTNLILLNNYGVSAADAAIIRSLVNSYQSRSIIPPERALVPQNFLPQNILQQYPQLKAVPDIRNLTEGKMIALGIDRQSVSSLQQLINNSIAQKLALPPARISSSAGLMVGDRNLNSLNPTEITTLLSSIPKKNRTQIALQIWQFLQARIKAGNPVTNLNELTAVPGVGQITVRNLDARNYTTNLNNLLLQTGDTLAASAIASRLEIGPKLAAAIVKEFRENGQFGVSGVDSVEDLIARITSRISRTGSKIVLSSAAIARIRAELTGKIYVMPLPVNQKLLQGVGDVPLLPSASTASSPPPSSPNPLVRPNRYTAPSSTQGKIIVGSTELRQQENRDRISRNVNEIENEFSIYQNNLTNRVLNSTKKSFGKKPEKLGTGLNKVTNKSADSLAKINNAKSRMNDAAVITSNAATRLEEEAAKVEALLDDLSDPLLPPYFNNAGGRVKSVSDKISSLTKEIDASIAEIEYNLNSPQREGLRANGLIDQLRQVQNNVESALEKIATQPDMIEQKGALLQKLQLSLDEIRGVRGNDVGSQYAAELGNLEAFITNSINATASTAKANIVNSIESQIAAVEVSIARLGRVGSSGALQSLTETKARLLATKNRINAMPVNVQSLDEPLQNTWKQTQQTRRRIESSTASLQESLSNYRTLIGQQVEEIRGTNKSIELLSINLEVIDEADGLTPYLKNRAAAIASNQMLIGDRLYEVDNSLNQLRLVSDPNVGIRYVMQNIPEAIESVDTSSGDLSTRVRSTPRGLDEAAQIRRAAINQLKTNLVYDAPEGQLSNALVNKVQSILDYNSPRQITLGQIDEVEKVIKEVTELKNKTALQVSRRAGAVRSDLEKLKLADPVAYSEINPQKILNEIDFNARFQLTGFEQRLRRLQKLKSALQKDLDTDVTYILNGQQTTETTLKQKLVDVRNEVTSLGRTRRNELDGVWREVVNSGVDPNSVVQLVKRSRGVAPDGVKGSNLTAKQKKLLSGLTPQMWKTLVDSVEVGAYDLYQELARLSGRKLALEKLASDNLQLIQKKLRSIEKDFGYNVTLRLEADGSVFLSDPVDIETNPDRFKRGRKSPERLLAEVRQLVGEGNEPFNAVSPRNYLEINEAVERNKIDRLAIDRRLEILNFNKNLAVVEFNQKTFSILYQKNGFKTHFSDKN